MGEGRRRGPVFIPFTVDLKGKKGKGEDGGKGNKKIKIGCYRTRKKKRKRKNKGGEKAPSPGFVPTTPAKKRRSGEKQSKGKGEQTSSISPYFPSWSKIKKKKTGKGGKKRKESPRADGVGHSSLVTLAIRKERGTSEEEGGGWCIFVFFKSCGKRKGRKSKKPMLSFRMK